MTLCLSSTTRCTKNSSCIDDWTNIAIRRRRDYVRAGGFVRNYLPFAGFGGRRIDPAFPDTHRAHDERGKVFGRTEQTEFIVGSDDAAAFATSTRFGARENVGPRDFGDEGGARIVARSERGWTMACAW